MEKTTQKYRQIQYKVQQALEMVVPPDVLEEAVLRLCQALGEGRDQLPPWLFVETVEQAPVAISITDDKANILYVNRAFTAVTGYSAEEIIGENQAILSDKSTPKRVYHELWYRLSEKKVWQGILVNRHRSGERYLADLTVTPMLDETGQVTHYLGMHRDVTEVHGLEQRVINQKTLIESVIDSMPVATVVLDEDDRVILDNQMYKALTSDLGVKEPALTFLAVLREEMKGEWALCRLNGRDFRNREIRIDPGGHRAPRWFSCAGSWFTEGDVSADAFFDRRQQTYMLLTLTDITQHKRQQEEIRLSTLRSVMAEHEQIQSLRETLSGAIHQIQGPMNLIAAARQILSRRGMSAENASLMELLKQVLDSGLHTVTTLQKCMPIEETYPVTSVNLNQILHEVVMLSTERLLACGIVVDWKPTPVLPAIMGHENRLRAMMKQLIDNAIDAMSRNGSKRRELTLSTSVEGDIIHVQVQDTGPGIPNELRTKVFEPFFTTNRQSGHQAGMGLVLVQDVVNRHEGIVEVDPDYTCGCRMHVRFKIHQNHIERKNAVND